MSTEENKKLVHRFFDEFWNRGDFTKADEIMANDYTVYPLGSATPITSAEAVRGFILSMRAAFPDLHIRMDDMLLDGDEAAVRSTVKGTHLGEYVGAPPTGKPVTVESISIIRFANGRIVEAWSASDNLSLMQQLGLMPAVGQVQETAA